jgi:hypothetical protein
MKLPPKSTNSNYLILVLFFIFMKKFMKNIKKNFSAYALYLDEEVGNE